MHEDNDVEDFYFRLAQQQYKLPKYDDPKFRRFVIDMYRADIEVEHYSGFMFQGPVVKVRDLRKVKTNVDVHTDQIGNYLMVYPT